MYPLIAMVMTFVLVKLCIRRTTVSVVSFLGCSLFLGGVHLALIVHASMVSDAMQLAIDGELSDPGAAVMVIWLIFVSVFIWICSLVHMSIEFGWRYLQQRKKIRMHAKYK
jgi:hypothetical protein